MKPFVMKPIHVSSVTTKGSGQRRNRFNVVFNMGGYAFTATDGEFLLNEMSQALVEYYKSCVMDGVHPDGYELPHRKKYAGFSPYKNVFKYDDKDLYIDLENDAIKGAYHTKTLNERMKQVESRIKKINLRLQQEKRAARISALRARLNNLYIDRNLISSEAQKSRKKRKEFIKKVKDNYKYLGKFYSPKYTSVGMNSGLLAENIKASYVKINSRTGFTPTNVRVVFSVPKKREKTVQNWKFFASHTQYRKMNEMIEFVMRNSSVYDNRFVNMKVARQAGLVYKEMSDSYILAMNRRNAMNIMRIMKAIFRATRRAAMRL